MKRKSYRREYQQSSKIEVSIQSLEEDLEGRKVAYGAINYYGTTFPFTSVWDDIKNWKGSTELFVTAIQNGFDENDFMKMDAEIKKACKKGKIDTSDLDAVEEQDKAWIESNKPKNKMIETLRTPDISGKGRTYGGEKRSLERIIEGAVKETIGRWSIDESEELLTEGDIPDNCPECDADLTEGKNLYIYCDELVGYSGDKSDEETTIAYSDTCSHSADYEPNSLMCGNCTMWRMNFKNGEVSFV